MGVPSTFKDEYLETAERYYKDPESFGDPVSTISGLAVALDCHRDTIALWRSKFPAFDSIVKKGEDVTNQQFTRVLFDKNRFTPGIIFAAKNVAGWSDKLETENTNHDTGQQLSAARQRLSKLKLVKSGKTKESSEDTEAA